MCRAQEGSASVEGLRVYVVEGVYAERRRARPPLRSSPEEAVPRGEEGVTLCP